MSSCLPCQISDSLVSFPFPLPGTPVDTPRPKRRRGCPWKVPVSTSTSTQFPDLSYDADVYCFCRRPGDGRLMAQCDQSILQMRRYVPPSAGGRMNASARRRTPSVLGSHLRRLPATAGSRGIQRRVRDIAAPQAEALHPPLLREVPCAPVTTRARKVVLEWLRLRLLGPGTPMLVLSEKVPSREVFSSPAPIPDNVREAMDVLCLEVGEEPIGSYRPGGDL
uniref:Uncharacterized protein LOC111109077 n=1 Tax=Crassostrea virginica TaxID=6565 RepID=A0A8B8BCF5_CRAVI|nr:uncharacterized protein LOC111109077 [Crassostrea virginica]